MESPPENYRISWSGQVLQAVTALSESAKRHALGEMFLDDLERMAERLGSDPVAWGDPLYEYHHLGLVVYRATLKLTRIHYAVDELRRIVYIQEVAALPGSKLQE